MKTKKTWVTMLSLCMLMSMVRLPSFTASAGSVFGGGEGTETNPYVISTATDLQNLATDVNNGDSYSGKYFKLINDIDMNEINFVPIGYNEGKVLTATNQFKGTFDGKGHVVKNLNINMPAANQYDTLGLFGTVGGGAHIKDVGVDNFDAYLCQYNTFIGGLVGLVAGNANIEGCFVNDFAVTTGTAYSGILGGLIGRVQAASSTLTVSNCYTSDLDYHMIGNWRGGMVGLVHSDTSRANFNNCYTTYISFGNGANTTAVNCYYATDTSTDTGIVNASFPQFCNTGVASGTLKGYAQTLGIAFSEDLLNANEGYPVLIWQIDSKALPGVPRIISSSPTDGSKDINIFNLHMNVEFDKYMNQASLTKENITVSPSTEYEIGLDSGDLTKCTIEFGELKLNTEYTVTFSSNIFTGAGSAMEETRISFTTVTDLPEPHIINTAPHDGETDVATVDTSVRVDFDINMNQSTLTEENITVSPYVHYEVVTNPSDLTKCTVSFLENLNTETTYTVTFSNAIKSDAGTSLAEKFVSFTTAAGLLNKIINGDMEDRTNLTAFNDGGNRAYISFVTETELTGKENSVLKLATGWAAQPVLQTAPLQPGRTYYMCAYIKSDSAQSIQLAARYDGAYQNLKEISVQAGVWTKMSTVFTVPDTVATVNWIAVVPRSQISIYVDNWQLYDWNLVMGGEPQIISTTLDGGNDNISLFEFKIDVVFDKPMDQDTLTTANITSAPSAISKIERNINDLTKCTVVFNRLNVNSSYTVKFSNNIKSLKDINLQAREMSFNTIHVSDKVPSIVRTQPALNAQDVSISNLKMDVTFDVYMDPETLTTVNITSEPDIIKGIVFDTKDLTKCMVEFDEEKLELGESYNITFSNGLKSLANTSMTETVVSFTTNSLEAIFDALNSAKQENSPSQMETFFRTRYADLKITCDLYDRMILEESPLLAKFYPIMAESEKVYNANDLKRQIEDSIFLITVNNSTSVSEIDGLIKSETSGLSQTGVLQTYNEILDTDAKTYICNMILNENFDGKSKEEVKDFIAEKIILKAIRETNGWGEVKEILELNAGSFENDAGISSLLTKMNALSSPQKAYNKLQGFIADSLKDVHDALEQAYNSVNSSPSPGGKSGGNSGGGGGSGSLSIKTSEVINDLTMQDQGKKTFNDIDDVAWAKESIELFAEKGIVSGKSANNFAPNDKVTREEFVKMLVLALNLYDGKAQARFDDVAENGWYYSYIASAVKANIINGISDHFFGIGSEITREDMATITYRVAMNLGITLSGTEEKDFKDEENFSDYAKEPVKLMRSTNIIQGVGEENFAPKDFSTRAQAVVIIDRLMKLLN